MFLLQCVVCCDVLFFLLNYGNTLIIFLVTKKRKSVTVQSLTLSHTPYQILADAGCTLSCAFTMIRVKTLLGKMFSLKISDQLLFTSSIQQQQMHELVCPACGAKTSCTSHDSYTRMLISIEQGDRVETIISVPRVLCHSCGHTHALLPDLLIPFGSYSLRFILSILWKYLHRTGSVERFCNTWQISISTLYGWIHLFEEQGSLWLGILQKISKLNTTAVEHICSLEDFPSAFFSRFHFSFMQVYKTTSFRCTPNDS